MLSIRPSVIAVTTTSDLRRFAVIVRGRLEPWQAACVQALAECGEALLVAVLDVSLGTMADRPSHSQRTIAQQLSVPLEPIATRVDFILSFVQDRLDSGLPTASIWRLRFDGVETQMKKPLSAINGGETAAVVVLADHGSMEEAQVLHYAAIRALVSPRWTLRALHRAAPVACVGALLRNGIAAPVAPECIAVPLSAAKQRPRISLFRRAVHAAATRLFLREIWTIGLIAVPIEAVLAGQALPAPRWLVPPRLGRFHADPFPLRVKDQTHLLFEMWSMLRGRGWIGVIPLEAAETTDPANAARAIDIGCHASFPATFNYNGNVYCAPEMWESGGLPIFQMESTPMRWTFVQQVLNDIPIVDPILFEHEGRWWLFATIRGQAPDVDLHAWYAKSPFGPWIAHRLNPVKSDVRSARPAGGTFRVGADLYRPAQDCSAGYGSAVVINRVQQLDPEVFLEIAVVRLAPGPDWVHRDGLHTINVFDGGLIIDAKRLAIDPLAPVWTLMPHARRWFQRRISR